MSWKIKINNDKYSIYSTITDDYIIEDASKDKFFRFIFWRKFEKMFDDFLKDFMTFPNGWFDIESSKILRTERKNIDGYFDLLDNRNEKFKKILTALSEIGIEIKMSDIDGVNFKNDEKENKND